MSFFHIFHKLLTLDLLKIYVKLIHKRKLFKAEFYSVSGKLLKTARFAYNNSIQYDGKMVPFISTMKIKDALTDAETTMEFGTVQVKKIAASEFDLGQIQ